MGTFTNFMRLADITPMRLLLWPFASVSVVEADNPLGYTYQLKPRGWISRRAARYRDVLRPPGEKE